MQNQSPVLRLAIPCYRENKRLPGYLDSLARLARERALPMSIQVVDDGSPEAEQRDLLGYVESLRSQNSLILPPIACQTNRGKGAAIIQGWLQPGPESWLAFADADGAVPAAATLDFLSPAFSSDSPLGVYCAAREHAARRKLHRAVGSRAFNLWTRACLGLGLRDTQCGLKMIPRTFFDALHTRWTETGFAFDLELLLSATQTGLPLLSRGVEWSEKEGSKLSGSHMLGLFRTVWRMRGKQYCSESP